MDATRDRFRLDPTAEVRTIGYARMSCGSRLKPVAVICEECCARVVIHCRGALDEFVKTVRRNASTPDPAHAAGRNDSDTHSQVRVTETVPRFRCPSSSPGGTPKKTCFRVAVLNREDGLRLIQRIQTPLAIPLQPGPMENDPRIDIPQSSQFFDRLRLTAQCQEHPRARPHIRWPTRLE